MLTNLAYWDRKRGNQVSFFATLDDLDDFFLMCLKEKYDSYDLLLKNDESGRILKYKLNELNKCVLENPKEWNYYIYSSELTSCVAFDSNTNFSSFCLLNGFLSLQIGHNRSNVVCENSIGIVYEIINLKTCEVRKYNQYLPFFYKLKRIISKHLIYTSLVTYKNGQTLEDPTLMMTEKMAECIRNGLNCRVQVGSQKNNRK